MPLIRRIPKRGFTNPFRVANQVVNLRDLEALEAMTVNPEVLAQAGLVGNVKKPVKILGIGEITNRLCRTERASGPLRGGGEPGLERRCCRPMLALGSMHLTNRRQTILI